jgi:hypothetical protein
MPQQVDGKLVAQGRRPELHSPFDQEYRLVEHQPLYHSSQAGAHGVIPAVKTSAVSPPVVVPPLGQALPTGQGCNKLLPGL